MATTGATSEQIEAAIPRFHAHFGTSHLLATDPLRHDWTRNNAYMTIDEAAAFLVPVGSAIVGPVEIAAIGRMVEREREDRLVIGPSMSNDAFACLTALVERTAEVTI